MRYSPRAAMLLALAAVTALLLVGTAAASQSQSHHVGKTTDACASPSAQDVADSDFFWYWPCASFLHVEINPSGQALGYVQSAPFAIDCPSACTRPFAADTPVVLTAYPSNGASFDSWSGDACAGQGNPCTAIVNGDTTVTANFSGRAIPANSNLVNLTIFFGFVTSALPSDDTYTFTNPPGGGGGLCQASSGNCTFSYAKGTIVSVKVNDNFSCHDMFHVNGSGIFGTYDSGTHSTGYSFAITSSMVLAPYIYIC